jgi:hypothetical protein
VRISGAYLETVLKNPFYMGRFIRQGIEYKGTHEPLVSPELFQRAHDTFAGRNKPKYRKRRSGPDVFGMPVRRAVSCLCYCNSNTSQHEDVFLGREFTGGKEISLARDRDGTYCRYKLDGQSVLLSSGNAWPQLHFVF